MNGFTVLSQNETLGAVVIKKGGGERKKGERGGKKKGKGEAKQEERERGEIK